MADQQPAPPQMKPYARHALICAQGECGSAEEAQRLYFYLAARLGELRKLGNPERVKGTLTECLGVCQGGPIVAVYPDGIWYHHVTEAIIDRIVSEHLIGGQPVEEYIFHRLYPAGQEPAYAPAVRGEADSFVIAKE